MDQFFITRKGDRMAPAEYEGDLHDALEWLRAYKLKISVFEICHKDTGQYMDADAFVALNTPGETPEEKMLREDMTDPHIHARNEIIYQHILRAMRLVNEPHYVPELLAKNTTHEIVRLFY